MASNDTTKSNDEIRNEMASHEDPAPVVNYTIGMIVVFIVIALVAAFLIGVYSSTNTNSSSSTETKQSEQRANP
jgi:flagellar basal body-associated protein FliL